MNVNKKVISDLTKCYSIAPLHYQGKDHILVAAEKQDPCYLFDLEGNYEEQIWDGPGGVMTMVQVPGSDGVFLSTYKFYSPNDSKEAKIVIVTPKGKDDWEIRTLCDLPHVHRFDILQRDGKTWLIACTLKSGHEYKDDWRFPGKVYVAELPEDLSGFDDDHQLELRVLKDNMLKNHGYFRVMEGDVPTCVISCDDGVYRFTPPAKDDKDWTIEKLYDGPASDAVLVDMDKDGEEELCVLSPFHGDQIFICKKIDGKFQKVYEFPEPAEFTHAIYGGDLCGSPAFVVGHRKGKKNLLLFRYDTESGNYTCEIIDEGRGAANVYHYVYDGKDILIATNRESDEVARYEITGEA